MFKFRPAIFWSVLFFAINLAQQPAWGAKQLVLKIVGAVEGQIITNRDVEASYIVDRVLYNDGAVTSVSYGTEEFKTGLSRLLIETMVRDEAKAFGVAKVPESEIEQEFTSVKKSIAAHAAVKNRLGALEISDAKLKDIVGRKLRANRFIKYKSSSSVVQVSDDEAREYFNKNRLKFGTMEFEGFKASIKKYLEKKNADERLRDWLEILRTKHKVKNLLEKEMPHESASAAG